MKYSLVILISLLLLSSHVISNNNKGKTLYRWENPSGDGYVWKVFGDKEHHSLYKGAVKNGRPNGLGLMIDNFGGRYVGGYKDGERNGQGTYIWSIGDKYIGKYKDDKRWKGIYYDKNENLIGKFVNGVKQK